MLALIGRIYGFFVNRSNRRFDAHKVPIVSVNIPVISVGNITTGGTGKTPLVQWIVKHLQEQGRKPAVVLRGYKRASRGLIVVHDGVQLREGVRRSGDEAFLHATALEVPVVVCASKVDAAVYAAGFLPCDVIVVDDGFQHRSLHRDIDVVIVNDETVEHLELLPNGNLREPVEELRRADVIVRVGVEPRLVYELRPLSPVDLNSVDKSQMLTLSDGVQSLTLKEGQRALPVTGIANPARFVETIGSVVSGAVVEPMTFRDHHRYSKADVRRIIACAQECNAVVLTTEKDAVKIVEFSSLFSDADVKVFVISTRIVFLNGEEELRALIQERIINEDSFIESVGESEVREL